jgi:8-oxo-dGTP pyrophosphatase MutT (NUDIX family)
LPDLFYDRWGNTHRPKTKDQAIGREGAWLALLERDAILFAYADYAPDVADIPGGGIDTGETVLDAACRELFEETDLTAPNDLTILNTHNQNINFYADDVDGYWHYTQTYFLATAKGTTLYFPEKRAVTEGHAAWIKIADLEKSAINYAHKMALNHLLKL